MQLSPIRAALFRAHPTPSSMMERGRLTKPSSRQPAVVATCGRGYAGRLGRSGVTRLSKARAARQAASPPARPGVIGAAAAGLALGLFVSFRYAISIWTPDSDMAVPLALWTGFQRHGWSFLASWRYTPDNWLLSLTPIDALVFSLAGPSPTTVAAVGWMIFAASVA